MKRYALALLLHPFKNCIIPRPRLREATSLLIETILELQQLFPPIRFNLVIPGYFLEAADPLLTARLRDLCKRSLLEVICTGYTEPFLSLSPPELTVRNIVHGRQVIEDITGQSPCGFLPPFSNWEPSFIAQLRATGFRYALLSNELFSLETRAVPGYWVTEHTGSSIGLIGTNVLSTAAIQNGFMDTVRSLFDHDPAPMQDPFAVLHYLMPLQIDKLKEACASVRHMVEEVDKNLLEYQPVCLGDFLSTVEPAGMQYVPTSLQLERRGSVDLHFMNYLFSFDQIGLLQRKTLDIFERVTPYLSGKHSTLLLNDLFFVQDINRLLPGPEAGFEVATDRTTTYRHLISIDDKLRKLSKNSGVRTRITDFLHNGGKSIILSNKNLKLFIAPQNGGQITGLDFRPRGVNLCSMYNPIRRKVPDIIVPGSSRTWFIDRILKISGDNEISPEQLKNDTSDFHNCSMNYKVRKNGDATTVSLLHTGAFLHETKQLPLSLEKVFGLENEKAELSFVYQLTNPSLMHYSFILTTELNLFLPGFSTNNITLHSGKNSLQPSGEHAQHLPARTCWYLEDLLAGIRVTFQTQKPVAVWYLPSAGDKNPGGVPLMLASTVSMEPSSRYKLIGKISFKTLTSKTGVDDAV